LPQWLTSFVGREREIADVLALLERGDIRLLTLTGTGGVGKTRLAVRVAELTDAFPDRAWFVPLAAIRDPALVVPTIANDLGVPAGTSNTAITELAHVLGNRHCLLLLDNFEQVVDAAVLVADILRACPNLHVLVTSRVPLNVSGEHVYLVPPMSLPPVTSDLSLDQVAANETVALFVKRSQAQSTGFTLSDANAGDIVDICHRLDGIPLAIELAASRVATLPLTALLERLDHRLATLTGGPRDAPDRLRSLSNAISWSHDLLTETEQALFRRLGVFANGFTLEAAVGIAGFDLDLVVTLDALLANNLVSLRSTASGQPRYLLLETIREFAADQLSASDENAAIRRRHAHWYMAMTEAAIPFYDGPDAWSYIRKVEAEIDNCRAALSWCVATGEFEIGIRIAGAIWRIWVAHLAQPWRDQFTEGHRWHERVLAGREGLPLAKVAEALHGISEFSHALGNLDEALAWAEELLTRSEAEDYPYGIRWASTTLGRIAFDRGDLEGATQWLERAEAISSRVRDQENHRAMALCDLAGLALHRGDQQAAINQLKEAGRLFQSCGNAFFLAWTRILLGHRLHETGDLDGALSHLAGAVSTCVATGDRDHLNLACFYIARIALDAGHPRIAARLHAAIPAPLNRWPEFEPDQEQQLARIQNAMGDDAFEQACHEGRQMTFDEVQAEVTKLGALLRDRPATKPVPTRTHGLTPRELDVLRLLTDGGSNRAIADALSLSERTVENHVLHILTKLGLDSRTAAATWAVRNGLA
jgi:non-specific serine/threonine protein kinase